MRGGLGQAKGTLQPGDYVLVKWVKPNTFEEPAYPHVLCMVN